MGRTKRDYEKGDEKDIAALFKRAFGKELDLSFLELEIYE